MFAWLIVTLEPPVLVIFSLSWELPPTSTLPKPKLDGLAVNAPGATPVPDSATFNVGLLALLRIARFPVAEPAVVGAKITLTDLLCPAASVKGNVNVPRLKPVPVIVACETVTLVPPVLVMFTLRF